MEEEARPCSLLSLSSVQVDTSISLPNTMDGQEIVDAFAADITCDVCRSGSNSETILLCDGVIDSRECPGACHTYCCSPPFSAVPDDEWFCDICKTLRSAEDCNNNRCNACGISKGQLLCCDTCPRTFHLRCIGLKRVPEGVWSCPLCQNTHSHDFFRKFRQGKEESVRMYSDNGDRDSESDDNAPIQCAFCKGWQADVSCGAIVEDDFEFVGPFRGVNGRAFIWAHRMCAIWSPMVFVKNRELVNVAEEAERAAFNVCHARCGKRGASLGCHLSECSRSYHYFCAKQVGCEFFKPPDYRILCPEHATAHVLSTKFNLKLPPPKTKKARTNRRREKTESAGSRVYERSVLQWNAYLATQAKEAHGIDSAREEPARRRCKAGSTEADSRPKPGKIAKLAPASAETDLKLLVGDFEARAKFRRELQLAKKERRREAKARSRIQPSQCPLDKDAQGKRGPWQLVGGQEDAIRSLKECVLLPLQYPELFQALHIATPRGIILHGPPGTGKTLLARSLASICSKRQVTFFSRKAADVLSKFYGETEAQLRALFAKARENSPSLIFFDEIDALCPVRSAKQNQVHSSIVTTLLSLMDGVDARGAVVVVAATNRIDSIDPALRRPGRFDREVFVGLPDADQRRAVLHVLMRKWTNKDTLVEALAPRTGGFSGADLQALCSEAVLLAAKSIPAIARFEPDSGIRGEIDNLQVHLSHFEHALQLSFSKGAVRGPTSKSSESLIYPMLTRALHALRPTALPYGTLPRRLLLDGPAEMGQAELLSAILASPLFEHYHVVSLSYAELMAAPDCANEVHALLKGFQIARHSKSVLVLPFVNEWWGLVSPDLRAALTSSLLDTPNVGGPVLLATSSVPWSTQLVLDLGLARIVFNFFNPHTLRCRPPSEATRRSFFRLLRAELNLSPTFPASTDEQRSEEDSFADLTRCASVTALCKLQHQLSVSSPVPVQKSSSLSSLGLPLHSNASTLKSPCISEPFASPVDHFLILPLIKKLLNFPNSASSKSS